jgi:hypothetical protein
MRVSVPTRRSVGVTVTVGLQEAAFAVFSNLDCEVQIMTGTHDQKRQSANPKKQQAKAQEHKETGKNKAAPAAEKSKHDAGRKI